MSLKVLTENHERFGIGLECIWSFESLWNTNWWGGLNNSNSNFGCFHNWTSRELAKTTLLRQLIFKSSQFSTSARAYFRDSCNVWRLSFWLRRRELTYLNQQPPPNAQATRAASSQIANYSPVLLEDSSTWTCITQDSVLWYVHMYLSGEIFNPHIQDPTIDYKEPKIAY